MKTDRIAFLLALLLCVPCARAADPAFPTEPGDGQALALHIRSSEPTENSEIHGRLQIRLKKKTQEIPVTCKVVRSDSTWKTIYQTAPANNAPAESLVVIHSATGPNQYLYARATAPTNTLPDLASVSSQKAATLPFAGSDFSLADLGLDFLHWPNQQRLKGEMRLGQPCYVLESRNDQQPEIVRVKSYIDKESGGLLIAEAFDRNGQTVKEFSLHGSSFKKVNGQWRLEKMEITNAKTDSQTTLKFELNE